MNKTVMAPSQECRAMVQELAEELAPELDMYALDLADAIHAGIEDMPDDLHAATRLSCRANLGLVVSMLQDDVEPESAVAPPEALHYARELVRRGIPIEQLIQCYRIGHASWWQVWLDRMREHIDDVEVLTETVGYCSDWFFKYIDTLSSTIADTYMEERERWVRSAAALRVDEVRAILDGRPIDEEQTSLRLRYQLRRKHVAIVVWGPDEEGADGTMGVYEHATAELGQALGGDVLSAPIGGMALAAWVGLREDPDPATLKALRLNEFAAASGARMAIGRPGEGLAGFRRSHHEAMHARRVAMLAARSPGSTVRFSDVALSALLTSDVAEARRFVEGELGPLHADTDSTRRLAATLRVFLEEGASFKRASRRLGVHENTVAYRVRRASELLGHGVEERQLELRVALQLADLLRRGQNANQLRDRAV